MATAIGAVRAFMDLSDDDFRAGLRHAEAATRSSAARMNRSFATIDRGFGSVATGIGRKVATIGRNFLSFNTIIGAPRKMEDN